jgi:hypothetical protein
MLLMAISFLVLSSRDAKFIFFYCAKLRGFWFCVDNAGLVYLITFLWRATRKIEM